MVVKITVTQLKLLLEGVSIAILENYRHGVWHEQFSLPGKYTLSIKVGRKRRMLPGRVVLDDIESGGIGHPGYDIMKFVPNSEEKLRRITNTR